MYVPNHARASVKRQDSELTRTLSKAQEHKPSITKNKVLYTNAQDYLKVVNTNTVEEINIYSTREFCTARTQSCAVNLRCVYRSACHGMSSVMVPSI
jgi:hypothetical protein